MEGGFGWIPRAGDGARPSPARQGPGRRGVSHLRVVHVPCGWMDGMACSAERETTTTSRRGDCSMPCVRREGDQSPVLHPPRASRSFLVPPHLTRRCCRTGTSPGLARHPARLSLQRPTNLPCPGGLGCLGARGPHHAGGFPGTQRRCRRAVPSASVGDTRGCWSRGRVSDTSVEGLGSLGDPGRNPAQEGRKEGSRLVVVSRLVLSPACPPGDDATLM